MKKMLKIAISLMLTFSVSVAFAEFNQGANAFLFNFGFTRGGMSLGVDYENAIHRTFSVGGYFRTYPDSTNPSANGLTTVGAFIRPHFNRQAWDLYLSPGFGIISLKPSASGASDETLMGPSFAIGLLYEFNPKLAIGIEEMTLYSWFGENDYRGFLSRELMGKVRFVY
ncbi:MAG: hypothetical protein A2Z20_03085 [Bdellovibrionales bacterium RBG_16_40_8]|nr:MAG: hypothetical protein A2Z20_03085 [Bdellovibrionales bacterium RBG_16_40_8]